MDKPKMHSVDKVAQNIEAIGKLFPNAITETVCNGKVEHVIDFDVLRQELSWGLVEGSQQRYQFTWPDKRKMINAANMPITGTLRPCREESVDFDNTQNLYIEGDNLDVLKLFQQTYYRRVKMIYIDPPYNTGKDFIYKDNFTETRDSFLKRSGAYDEQGNRLVQNLDTNGQIHTDWLNMIYPRLRMARDLLTEDGVIFISIDDNEVHNMRKICDEIFGAANFVAQINWKGRGGRQDSKYYAVIHEYIICYANNINYFVAGEEITSGDIFPKYDEDKKRYYKTQLLRKWGSNSRREDRPNLYYAIKDPDGNDLFPVVIQSDNKRAGNFSKTDGCWRWGQATMARAIKDGCVEFIKNKENEWIPYEKIFAPLEGEEKTKKFITWIDDIGNGTPVLKGLFGNALFDYAKSPELILRFINMAKVEKDSIVLDFFSGSATTAHAVMQLNAEDGGHRKFIMVQLPEKTNEKSEAYKAGYKNICEIGKERIRRAGKLLSSRVEAEEKSSSADGGAGTLFYAGSSAKKSACSSGLDVGFRVLKLDSSCMTDVYYHPDKAAPNTLKSTIDNIKDDRTPEDLLFQVMLEKGIVLSCPIEVEQIAGKRVFSVDGGFLIACFDRNVTNQTIVEIAKRRPKIAVFRYSSLDDDPIFVNIEVLFQRYSKDTRRYIL